MSFTRDDLTSYESQPAAKVDNFDPWTKPTAPPEVKNSAAAPEAKNEEAEVDAAIAASVTQPDESGTNDGSTTETKAETVAAESATPEGEKDPEMEEVTDGDRPRSRAQERIEELVAERNALRKYGEYLLSQVEGSRKASASTATAPQQDSAPAATKDEEDIAPTLESADYDPIKLNKLQNEWINRQVKRQVESAVKTIESRQSEQAVRQAFEQRTAEFRKSFPDFDMIIANPALPSLAPEAARAVVRSEQGPAIAYHLAKNPDLAARISRLDPVSQAVAVGRLEEQLTRTKTETKDTTKEPSKQVTKAPVKVTQAPPPPKPVTASSSPSRDEGIMSMEEWVANDRAKKLKQKSDRLALRKAMR